jgi:hypothetical protein
MKISLAYNLRDRLNSEGNLSKYAPFFVASGLVNAWVEFGYTLKFFLLLSFRNSHDLVKDFDA